MKNEIRLKLNLSFLYRRQLTRHFRTCGLTGLTLLEIFASVLAHPFFHPDGLIISTAVKYAKLLFFILFWEIKYQMHMERSVCVCIKYLVSVTTSFPQNNELLSLTILCTLAKLCWQMALTILKFQSSHMLKCFTKHCSSQQGRHITVSVREVISFFGHNRNFFKTISYFNY